MEREIMSKSIPQEYITFFNDNFEQLRRLENYRKEYEENCKRAVKRIIQQNELMKDVNRNEKQNHLYLLVELVKSHQHSLFLSQTKLWQ